jgi:hypothetical protein
MWTRGEIRVVEHPRESAPSARVASAVGTSGGRAELKDKIDVKTSEARAFRDVTSPTEAYDLLLGGEIVGQVIHDESPLKGVPHGGDQWVLVQRDADYSLATASRDDAIEHARSIVAARMAATGENPSGPGQVRRGERSRRMALRLTGVALSLAALLAFVVRVRAR